MKPATLIISFVASITAATPIVSGEESALESRKSGCLYKHCWECWAATPPIGSGPGSQGAAAGQ